MQKLTNSFPLAIVRIYKVKWWNEHQTKFCRKENVDILLTHILEVLEDHLAIRQIFLQKLLDNEDLADDSFPAELATKLRIYDP